MGLHYADLSVCSQLACAVMLFWNISRWRLSLLPRFRRTSLRLCARVACRCWPRSLVVKLQVDEMYFMLQLLVGCRVGVAVRASPLQ